MSIATFIMGKSGHGKSTSLRNLDPQKTIIIQAVNKPLPFPAKNWKQWDSDTKTGSIAVTDSARNICAAIERAKGNGKEIIIIDDFQYIMSNEFMRRRTERGFDKFTEIAGHAWDVLNTSMNSDNNLRVYMLTHTDTDEWGQNAKVKTIGKLLDDKIVLEGMVTIVLKAVKTDQGYMFQTQSDGTDTVKSPMGLFEQQYIDNDLAFVDKAICDYYGIEEPKKEEVKK